MRHFVEPLACPHCISIDGFLEFLHTHWTLTGRRLFFTTNTISKVGDGTARIGDPSDRVDKRKSLPINQYETNADEIERDIRGVLQNYWDQFVPRLDASVTERSTMVMRNSEWLSGVDWLSFVGQVAPHFRMSELLNRDSFRLRLESGHGMDLSEFLYPTLQAMDFLHLFQNHNCRMQIGGHDQIGNIQCGLDLIRRRLGGRAFGLTVPLLTTPEGQKFGKSVAGSGNSEPLWLSREKLLPYKFFQRILNLPDRLISEQLIRQLTFFKPNEVKCRIAEHTLSPQTRPVQRSIARELTLLVHGVDGLQSAELATRILFPLQSPNMGTTSVNDHDDDDKSTPQISNILHSLSSTERDYLHACLTSTANLLPVLRVPQPQGKLFGQWLVNVLLHAYPNATREATVQSCLSKGVLLNGIVLLKPRSSGGEADLLGDSSLTERLSEAIRRSDSSLSLSLLRVGKHDHWFVVIQNP